MKLDHVLAARLGIVFLTNLLSFGVGIWMAAGSTADDLDKFAFSLLSVLGSWVAGIGAIGAIVAVLYVASIQMRDARKQDAVRCIHHAMAVTNDLMGRVKFLQKTIAKNGVLSSLTVSAELISRRYEALYDRDLYRHLSGPVIDKITGMSGSFFGIQAMSVLLSANLKNDPLANLPDMSHLERTFESLNKKLDELFTALEAERNKLDDH